MAWLQNYDTPATSKVIKCVSAQRTKTRKRMHFSSNNVIRWISMWLAVCVCVCVGTMHCVPCMVCRGRHARTTYKRCKRAVSSHQISSRAQKQGMMNVTSMPLNLNLVCWQCITIHACITWLYRWSLMTFSFEKWDGFRMRNTIT